MTKLQLKWHKMSEGQACDSVTVPLHLGLTKRSLWLNLDYWVWCVAEDCDVWGELSLRPDSDAPAPLWFDHELDICSLAESLRITDVETVLLNQGIAPEQPFLLHLEFDSTYYPATPNGPAEWDTEVRWTVSAIEPWPLEKTARAWETLYGRKHLMEVLP